MGLPFDEPFFRLGCGMNDKRKKIIGSGILVICIASMLHASNERESPSMGWMLALSASWSLIVWLWPEKYARKPNVDWPKLKRRIHVSAIWIIIIGGIITLKWLVDHANTLQETKPRDYAKEVMLMDNSYMLEQERSQRIEKQKLNDGLHQRHPELGPAPIIPKGPYERMDEILKGR